MQDSLKRIKKVHPLVRAKKAMLDQEASTLAQIRQEKIAVVQRMKENQKKYMDGVDHLNVVRESAERSNLETLENGLDLIKSKWYQLYKDVQTVEQKEKAQMGNVLNAQRELKKMEKLREKYEKQYHAEISKGEQKEQDELSLQRYVREE
jgi:flagellar export protein FliJ